MFDKRLFDSRPQEIKQFIIQRESQSSSSADVMGKPYSCVWFFLMLSNRFPIVTYFSISEYTATHTQGGLPNLMVRVLCYNKGCHGYKTSNHHRDIKGTVFGATKMLWLQLQFCQCWTILNHVVKPGISSTVPNPMNLLKIHLTFQWFISAVNFIESCLEGWHRNTWRLFQGEQL